MPVISLFCWYKVQQSSIKSKVKWEIAAGLDPSDLVLIKLTPKEAEEELEWKHSKEFQYQGEMYDIVQRENQGDTLLFYCWWDHEETQLNKKVWSLTHQLFHNDQEKKQKENQLLKVYKNLYSQEISKLNLTLAQAETEKEFHYQGRLISRYITPPSPPPK